MKLIKKVVLVYLCLAGFQSKAQLAVKIDSNVTGTVYTGIASGIKYLIDSQRVSKFVTVRVGAHAKWQIAKKLKLNAFTVLEFGTDKSFGIYNFALVYNPSSWLTLTGGYTPPPLPLLLRPYPLSGNSQFETWTQQRIPGAAPSFYATIGNKGPKAYAGATYRDYKVEFEGEVSYHAFTAGGYVRDSLWGIAGQVSTKRYFQLTVFDNHQILATTSVFNVRAFSFYGDIGFNFETGKLPRLEVGVLRNFSSKLVAGLFGLGYQVETNSVNGYLFFHL